MILADLGLMLRVILPWALETQDEYLVFSHLLGTLTPIPGLGRVSRQVASWKQPNPGPRIRVDTPHCSLAITTAMLRKVTE